MSAPFLRQPTDDEAERLLYRRQFVLGPRAAPRAPGWPTYPLPGGLTLSAHPDLPVTQVTNGGIHLTLAGYLLDPDHPERGDREILEAIASETRQAGDACALTYRMGGRWTLFADDGHSTVCFTDPAGMRQVFHTGPSFPETWCASQAGGIADALRLEVSAEAREFLAAPYTSNFEYWWPNGTSPYAGVRRLIPNHYLDLRTRAVRRFWPAETLATVDFDEAVEVCAALQRGILHAAARRFPLALPVTAGFDSRLLLAAAREVASEVYFYTFRAEHLTPRSGDLVVPPRLMRRLGLPHHMIDTPSHGSGRFAEVYRRNVNPAHPIASAIAQGLYNAVPEGRICVAGHAAEIMRCGDYYRPEWYPNDVTPKLLAKYTYMTGVPLALREFGVWLEEAKEVERASGVRALDLFHWEQWVGNWAADGEAEWDLIFDRLPAYSCRALIATELGVDATRRQKPTFDLQAAIIRRLWPEVLDLPFNPYPRTMRDQVRDVLERVHLAGLARAVRDRLQGRR